jgi:hypothetical protein
MSNVYRENESIFYVNETGLLAVASTKTDAYVGKFH